MAKILVVDADAAIAELEKDFLEVEGFTVDVAVDGPSGLEKGLAGDYDLILLDVMLPGMDGFHVCRKLREETEIPILMVTAKTEDIDKVRGIGLGADDYISKPFSPVELVARVKGSIKRYERLTAKGQEMAGGASTADDPNRIVVDDIVIDEAAHRVYRGGQEIQLTNLEFSLLAYLAKNAGIVCSKDKLFEAVWGYDADGDASTVMVTVKRLREKIERDPSNPYYIETVWGVGYRFVSK